MVYDSILGFFSRFGSRLAPIHLAGLRTILFSLLVIADFLPQTFDLDLFANKTYGERAGAARRSVFVENLAVRIQNRQ
jgi:hypothetical protein